MTDTTRNESAEHEQKRPSLFITGWLTREFEAGRRPIYGYPASPLPEVTGGDMEVVTGFMAGHR